MAHVHEPPTVEEHHVHEAPIVERDAGVGVGILVALAIVALVAGAVIWVALGGFVGRGAETPPEQTTPDININPGNINVAPPNINVAPPADSGGSGATQGQ